MQVIKCSYKSSKNTEVIRRIKIMKIDCKIVFIYIESSKKHGVQDIECTITFISILTSHITQND